MGKPIIEHQAIAHKIADMAVRTEAARLLARQSAWLLDTGRSNTRQVAYAKVFAADSAMSAAIEAVQIFGGMGYSTEYPVEKLFRDAKVLQIYEGPARSSATSSRESCRGAEATQASGYMLVCPHPTLPASGKPRAFDCEPLKAAIRGR